jgi:hypothetical protein
MLRHHWPIDTAASAGVEVDDGLKPSSRLTPTGQAYRASSIRHMLGPRFSGYGNVSV